MIIKFAKIFITSILITFLGAFSAFAADSFPFEIEFGVEEIDRLCYAGHWGEAVKYRRGIAVTPDTWFTVTPVSGRENNIKMAEGVVSELSAEISLIYENDNQDGSYTETLKTYETGSLSENESFQLLSENNIANLKERGKLYSDQLMGLMLTFCTRTGSGEKKKTIYLYVCSDDDFNYFYSNSM